MANIDFDDLLSTVALLKIEIDSLDGEMAATMRDIDSHRKIIDDLYAKMQVIEKKRNAAQSAAAALSHAMARTIMSDKNRYITAYQAIQELEN